MTARKRLRRALDDAAELGLIVPCTGRDEWISDAAEERSTAARLCDGCPCLDECQVVADELAGFARFGAWAGVDITPQPKTTTARQGAEPCPTS